MKKLLLAGISLCFSLMLLTGCNESEKKNETGQGTQTTQPAPTDNQKQ